MTKNAEVEILLVEDNARDAELTLRALQKRHLVNAIVHVRDGQEALDWLDGSGTHAGRDRNLRPKVILLDLKLPKLSGLEVLRAIRSEERTRLLPVVVLTSSREDTDIAESYKLGVNSYIVKPVDFDNFSAAVAQAGQYWLLINERPR
jgi:two-component system, response regulator